MKGCSLGCGPGAPVCEEGKRLFVEARRFYGLLPVEVPVDQ